MSSQTPLGEFRPNELHVKKLPATMGLLWHPQCKRARKSRKQDFGWKGVEGDKDSSGRGAKAVSDVTSLATTHLMKKRIQKLCLAPSTRHGMNTPWRAIDDEASVDDAIDVALNDMDSAAPSPDGDPTHMDVPTQMPAEMAVAPLEEPVGSQGLPSAVTVVLAEGTITLVILLQSVRTLAIKEGRGAESIGRATLARCLQEDGLWDG